MNAAQHEFLSILRVADLVPVKADTTGYNYLQVLDSVRTKIAEHHAKELAAVLDDPDAALTLKTLIYQYAAEAMAGHTILTSFHADGAKDGYERLASLCQKAGSNLSNIQLLEKCVKAWPIIVYQKQLKDNTRKMMEIYEATGVQNGQVKGAMLYRFVVEETERDGHGSITKVYGHHERCGCISPRLYQRLWDNGAPLELLQRLFPDGHGEDEDQK